MDGKGAARTRRSHSGPGVVAPRNKVNVAFPLSVIKAAEPTRMRAGDWISLAGLATSVLGFSVVIRALIRIARTPEMSQLGRRADQQEGTLDASLPLPGTEERIS